MFMGAFIVCALAFVKSFLQAFLALFGTADYADFAGGAPRPARIADLPASDLFLQYGWHLGRSTFSSCDASILWLQFAPKMFAPSISRRAGMQSQRAAARPTDYRSPITNHSVRARQRDPESIRGFTLLELLIVVGIIGLLLVLLAPAFTSIKSGSDFSSAVNGIRDVLENARTYAKANHTYVFVGLAEVDASVDSSATPQLAGFGRVAIAVVASKDGTRHFNYTTGIFPQGPDWTANYSNGANLTAVGKLQRFENLHFMPLDFGPWAPTGANAHPNSKMARYQPTVNEPYVLGRSGSISVTPFSWPLGSALNSGQYQFNRVIYFDPTGIARIATSSNSDAIADVIEIAFQPSHGTAIPPLPTNQDAGNHAVVQLGTTDGAVRVYRP
jgi:prepilin-type N-terminal cleavage/methylation domain-containing protein